MSWGLVLWVLHTKNQKPNNGKGNKMRLGTKSLLFGCHQFIIHPIFTLWAAFILGWKVGPPIKRLLAIIAHDWGYWGCRSMDSGDGRYHPIKGSKITYSLTRDPELEWEVFFHSRFMNGGGPNQVSGLCWVDKLSVCLMPSWLWAFLALLSGEGREYLSNPQYSQYRPGEPYTFRNLVGRHKAIRAEILPTVKQKFGSAGNINL